MAFPQKVALMLATYSVSKKKPPREARGGGLEITQSWRN
jgi:hypothetical protein